ncbi:MAG: hypothetical protein DMF58_00295 [Acidobacteria bacterium]|nr:MAG: hypothetical protein DMF58_00295 [Acidobacteriota bacterium]
MNPLAHFLLLTALSIPTNTLVLRSGQRVDVDGSVKIDNGRVLFRSGGALYSVSENDVDVDATRAAGIPISIQSERAGRLKVSAEEKRRLLKELEENHSGTPAPANALNVPPGPTAGERQQATQDEWAWRQQARSYEESIRRAKENLDLLEQKAAALKAHIAGLLSLGYKPDQFSYDTTQLAYTIDAIPGAELEVQRAQRAYDQFRDDARRMDVTPGWIR